MGERFRLQDLGSVVNWARVAKTHIVLDSSVVNQIRVIVQDHLSADVIQQLLPLFILRLFVVTNRSQGAPVADDFGQSGVCRTILSFGLLSQELVFIFKACYFEEGLTVVTNKMVTNLQLLCKICVFYADEIIVANHFLLAVDEKFLACLDFDARLASFDLTESDSRSLQVYIDATLLARYFGSFTHHFNQDLVLFVLDLPSVYSTDVHAFVQELNNCKL